MQKIKYMSSYVEGRLKGWKGWQVNYPEDMMGALLLGKLIDAFWLGDRDIWEELNPMDFKILMIKYTEINIIYLDSNLPFKNSLGLKLQKKIIEYITSSSSLGFKSQP